MVGRFLTLADKLLTFTDVKSDESNTTVKNRLTQGWETLGLNVSYRVTGNMAKFVNEVLLY